MEFKVGGRVALINNLYGDSNSNPVWGGKKGHIVGTVDNILSRFPPMFIGVMWDNGIHNSYYSTVLNLVPGRKSNEPNLTFKLKNRK